jgi:hypothetical protein
VSSGMRCRWTGTPTDWNIYQPLRNPVITVF